MKKKYRIYSWITLFLVLLAIVLYVTDKQGTLKVEPGAFAISDTSALTKIQVSDGTTTLVLERQGEVWLMNEAFNARPKAVKTLLSVLSGLEVSSPVSRSMNEAVLNSFKTGSVTVTAETSGQVVKSYRISENDSLGIGTFAMLSGDHTPYMIRLMGYNGPITRLFPVNPLFWRDKTIFSYRPADILSIETQYPFHPEYSFDYQFFGPKEIKIKSEINHQAITIDKNTARNYLLGFSSVLFQLIEPERAKVIYDSLILQKPFCEIKVKDTGNRIKDVRAFRIPDPKKSGSFNVNFMYALIQDDKIPVIVKYIDFDLIMRKFQDFASK
jgi:hypothetical protein